MIINMTGGGSGGAALNFDVVRYATKSALLAATPKENTIGIISTTEMTGWIIDANQPENMTNGMVWISGGTESTAEFNALKKNGLQVYPMNAKQMVSGKLLAVDAMSYQDGAWVEWIPVGALFWRGNQCTSKTGGWQLVKQEGIVGGTVSVYGDNLVIDGTSTEVSAIAMCKSLNSSFLNGKSYVRVKITSVEFRTGGACFLRILKSATDHTKLAEVAVTGSGEFNIPVSGITSGQFAIFSYNVTTKASEIEVV